jgi:hypothetical protein
MAEHASQAIIGRGTLLQRGGLLPGDPYETVTEVTEFGIPDESAEDVEVTHSESPDGYNEKIQGFKDGGDASATVNWRPDVYASQAALRDDKASGVRRWYRFVLPNAMETIPFFGFVKNIKRNVTPKGAITAAITWSVSRVSNAA